MADSLQTEGLKARKKIAQGKRCETSVALGQRNKMNSSPERAKELRYGHRSSVTVLGDKIQVELEASQSDASKCFLQPNSARSCF